MLYSLQIQAIPLPLRILNFFEGKSWIYFLFKNVSS